MRTGKARAQRDAEQVKYKAGGTNGAPDQPPAAYRP
jgi:hypothetical protein